MQTVKNESRKKKFGVICNECPKYSLKECHCNIHISITTCSDENYLDEQLLRLKTLWRNSDFDFYQQSFSLGNLCIIQTSPWLVAAFAEQAKPL